MKKKKILKFFICGAILGLVVIFIFNVVRERSFDGRGVASFPTPISFPTVTPFSGTAVTPTIELPPIRGGKLVISGIEVEDFLGSPVKINQAGDVLFVSNEGYHILYFSKDRNFLISILDSPFEKVRERAEREFLRQLGISQEEACKLDVVITTPYFANPDFAGKNYGLSFCE